MLEPLKRSPIPVELLPGPARKVFEPSAPLPLRTMAAKALLPLMPVDMFLTLYQLSFDPDAEVRQGMLDTVAKLELETVLAVASEALPEAVLDWLAELRPEEDILKKIVLNKATADVSIMNIASRAGKALTEIIAANHIRLLRAPQIIEVLYLNPETRMATLERVLALVREQKLELHGLKVLQEALASPDYGGDGLSDEDFEQLLVEAHKKSLEEKPDEPPLASRRDADEAEEEEEEPERQSRMQLIEKMSAPQRIRLALIGSREDRNILIRDTRRIVYMSVVRSPKLSLNEVSLLASSRNIPDDVIAYIASKREWVRYYPIMVSLVNNPKCPLADAVSFLRQLRANDLKALQRSKNVPAQLARQAQAIYRQKSQGR